MNRARLAAAVIAVTILAGNVSQLDAQRLRGRARPDPEQIVDRIEGLAELDRALSKIELTEEQADTLDRIEQSYRDRFAQLARDAQRLFGGSGRPGRDALMEVADSTRALREEELSAARAILTAEQQVPFDENVERLLEEANEQAERLRSRINSRRRRGGD